MGVLPWPEVPLFPPGLPLMAASLAELEAKVTAETSSFNSKMSDAGLKIDGLGDKAQPTNANFAAGSGAMAAGAPGIAAAYTAAIGTAADFDNAPSGIAAAGGANAVAAMDQIRAKPGALRGCRCWSHKPARCARPPWCLTPSPVRSRLASP